MAVAYTLFVVLILLYKIDVCVCWLSSMAVSSSNTDAVLIVVDQSGKGDYKMIQQAINAVASDNSELMYILIKPGVYRFILYFIFSFH